MNTDTERPAPEPTSARCCCRTLDFCPRHRATAYAVFNAKHRPERADAA